MTRDGRREYALLVPGLIVFTYGLLLHYRLCPAVSSTGGYLQDFATGDEGKLFERTLAQTYYPPLYYAFHAVVGRVLGYDYLRAVFACALFVVGGAVYLTALARRLGFGTLSFVPGTALLLLPGTFLASRVFAIEMPLILCLPAFAFHLVACRGFGERRHSIYAGLWAGLGLLTKWTFPAYLPGAVVLALAAGSGPAGRPAARRRGRNAVLLAATAAAVAGWWYLGRMRWDLWVASAGNDPTRVNPSFALSLRDLLAGLGRLAGGRFVWLPGVFVVVGIIIARRPLATAAGIAAALLLPVMLLAVPVHNETRYLLPLLPAVAMALGVVAHRARWPMARAVMSAALVAMTAYLHFAAWPLFCDPAVQQPPLDVCPPTQASAVARYLTGLVGTGKGKAGLGVHPFFQNVHANPEYLGYYLRRDGAIARFDFPRYGWASYGSFHDDLRTGRFAVIVADCGPRNDCAERPDESVEIMLRARSKSRGINQNTGETSPDFSWDDVRDDWAWLAARFEPRFTLPLDDGTTTRVWVRRDFVPGARPAGPGPAR